MPFLWLYYQGTKFYNKDKVEAKIRKTTEKYDRMIAQAEGKETKLRRLRRKKDKKLDNLEVKLEEGNFLMRKGEAPVVFDSALSKQTAEQMRFYLYSKGFFQGNTSFTYQLNPKKRTASVTYHITENQPYTIRDTLYITTSKRIDSLLEANKQKAEIEPGDQYDRDKLEAEQARIDKLMKNNGYYLFSKQYVTYEVDSTVRDSTIKDTSAQGHKVDIYTTIKDPAKSGQHRLFRVDAVYFTEDASNRRNNAVVNRDTVRFRDISYLARQHHYSRKALDTKLLIRPGTLYSLDNTIETQRLLTSMDIFRYANIYYDTTGGKFTAQIYTSPIDKYSYSAEGGGTLSAGLPGPFGSLNFKVRNVFNGMEIFEVRGTGGIEGQLSFKGEAYASQEANLTSSLTFPRILFPTPFRNQFNRWNPSTRLSVGYNLSNRPEYRRYSFRAAMTYSWQPSPKHNYSVSIIDVSRIYSNTTSEFEQTLEEFRQKGSTLWRSFRKSFVTSTSVAYTFNGSLAKPNSRTYYLRLLAESGGTYLNLFPKSSFLMQGDSLRDGLQFYRFLRFNADFRYYIPQGKHQTWAFRVNAGYARPYGQSKSLPYEKFFFAGGSNSVRAWQPRRLGLGGSPDSVRDGRYDYSFEQPGDILLEASAELRRDLVSFLEGAIFIDAGNTWISRKDSLNPNGDFALNRFYKEIAVGGGIGLRLDFSFLILRFDLATKLYDPGRIGGEKWAYRNLRRPFYNGQTVLNVGIGYPF